MESNAASLPQQELSSRAASSALSGAFAKKLAGLPPPSPYLIVMQSAGRIIQHVNRMVWTDVFSAWEQFHDALGLPMDWQGAYAQTPSIDLIGQVGYVLRSLGTPDSAMALASADRQFRRARLSCFRELEQTEAVLIQRIKDDRYEPGTLGALKQQGDIADLVNVRQRIQDERAVLMGGK